MYTYASLMSFRQPQQDPMYIMGSPHADCLHFGDGVYSGSLSWFALHSAPGPTPVPLTEGMNVVLRKIVTTPQRGRGFPTRIQKL